MLHVHGQIKKRVCYIRLFDFLDSKSLFFQNLFIFATYDVKLCVVAVNCLSELGFSAV